MMKSRKILSFLLLLTLLLSSLSFVGCGKSDKVTVAIPNDSTNEARALKLLEAQGILELKEGVGLTATVQDIKLKPENVEFVEVEAAQLPDILKDNDYAVINTNYAIEAGLNPKKDALALEDSYSAYSNIVAVKEGNENDPRTKALAAALQSQKVADSIKNSFDGAVISTVDAPGDGFDAFLDYDALSGVTITVAASPTPHAKILEIAAEILAEKNITLEIKTFTDYSQLNTVVDSGEVYANYFQHLPYLEDFNQNNGTHVVSVAAIHVEPMGIYGGKQTNLDALKLVPLGD